MRRLDSGSSFLPPAGHKILGMPDKPRDEKRFIQVGECRRGQRGKTCSHPETHWVVPQDRSWKPIQRLEQRLSGSWPERSQKWWMAGISGGHKMSALDFTVPKGTCILCHPDGLVFLFLMINKQGWQILKFWSALNKVHFRFQEICLIRHEIIPY